MASARAIAEQRLELARPDQLAPDEFGGDLPLAHRRRGERGVPVGFRDPPRAQQDDLKAGRARGLAGGNPAARRSRWCRRGCPSTCSTPEKLAAAYCRSALASLSSTGPVASIATPAPPAPAGRSAARRGPCSTCPAPGRRTRAGPRSARPAGPCDTLKPAVGDRGDLDQAVSRAAAAERALAPPWPRRPRRRRSRRGPDPASRPTARSCRSLCRSAPLSGHPQRRGSGGVTPAVST